MRALLTSESRRKDVADIFKDVGQVLFGSVSIGSLLSIQVSTYRVLIGFLAAVLFWLLSVYLTKNK